MRVQRSEFMGESSRERVQGREVKGERSRERAQEGVFKKHSIRDVMS